MGEVIEFKSKAQIEEIKECICEAAYVDGLLELLDFYIKNNGNNIMEMIGFAIGKFYKDISEDALKSVLDIIREKALTAHVVGQFMEEPLDEIL